MNIHEFQAKRLLAGYKVAVARGDVAETAADAKQIAHELNASFFAVKAQIHAGDRDRAGGVRLVDSIDGVGTAAAAMLGQRLVTQQTGPGGKTVNRVYVEQGCDTTHELYFGMLVDRGTSRVTAMASTEGGADIEQIAVDAPGSILRLDIDSAKGLTPAHTRKLNASLELAGEQAKQAARIMRGVYKAFVELDASLIEINPLVVTTSRDVLALDVKMSLDDNALFRHSELEDLRDLDEEDADRLERGRHGFNYIKLGGNIGCLVTGAGLALATVDLLKLHGGEAANFLDLPPSASRMEVAAAFKRILADPQVEAILVNAVGGGFTRCDVVAEGIISASREVDVRVPLVVRFEATNTETGMMLLKNSRLEFTAARGLDDAARKVTRAVGVHN